MNYPLTAAATLRSVSEDRARVILDKARAQRRIAEERYRGARADLGRPMASETLDRESGQWVRLWAECLRSQREEQRRRTTRCRAALRRLRLAERQEERARLALERARAEHRVLERHRAQWEAEVRREGERREENEEDDRRPHER